MEEKILEADKSAKSQIIELDPMREIESKLLQQQISTNFKYFIN